MKDEAPYQYTDTIDLFNYGFSNFDKVKVSEAETKYNINTSGSFYSSIDVLGNSEALLELNKDACVMVPKTIKFEELESDISYDTDDEREAAVIIYSYGGQLLGASSVDFSIHKEGYTFDELPSSIAAQKEKEERAEETKVVFINVVRIALIVFSIGGAGVIIYLIVHGIFSYRRRHPNWRANWKREKRKRKSKKHNPTIHQEARMHRQAYIVGTRRRTRGRKRVSKHFK